MPPEDALKIEKLQAEIEKIRAESLQADAETYLLNMTNATSSRGQAETLELQARIARIRAETRKINDDKPSWLKENTIALLTILSLGGSFVYGVVEFLNQQSDRDEFKITSQVISLVDRLSKSESGNAAILLASYNEHAVPILLNSLNDKKGRIDFLLAVQEALILIAQDHPEAVTSGLNSRTLKLSNAVIKGDTARIGALTNHIAALGQLRTIDSTATINKTLTDLGVVFHCDKDSKPSDLKLKKEHRVPICQAIENATSL